MHTYFLRNKPCIVITALRDQNIEWYLSKLAKETGTTYVYITGIISLWEKSGLVKIESKGKKRFVRLTEKGAAIAALLEEIKKKFEG